MTKKNILLAIIGIGVIGGLIAFTKNNSSDPKIVYYSNTNNNSIEPSPNVTTEGEKQIIEVTAKGGYSPKITNAKAGIPTILRVQTNSTFDCSAALRIKSIGYSKNLPATGTTDIELPAQSAGSTIKALCSMGMYNFSVQFSS
jgi:plastocyanin domain-containing protein